MNIGSSTSPSRERVRLSLAAVVMVLAALLAPRVEDQYTRVTMTALAVHALMPELGPPPGVLWPIDRELVAVADEMRSGRFRSAEERLRSVESRAANDRDRFMSMVFRRELQRFRISVIGGGLPSDGDLAMESFPTWGDGAALERLSKNLGPAEAWDAVVAERYAGLVFLALTQLPEANRARSMGFGSDGNRKWIDKFRSDTADMADAAKYLSPGARRRLNHLIDGIAAATADAPDDAASHFQRALEGQFGSAKFAILLRIGDAYAFPAGDALTSGVDVASAPDLVALIERGEIPKFSVPLSDARRRKAGEWYARAATAASTAAEQRAVRLRTVVLEPVYSPERLQRLEELAAESAEDLSGWAASAAMAVGRGRPSGMSDAIEAALRQDATGIAVSFTRWSAVMARTYPFLESDIAIGLLESASRAAAVGLLDRTTAEMMGALAAKYRESGRFSAAAVAARLAVERQTRFVSAYRAAAARVAQANSLENMVGIEQALLGRLILEWRAALALASAGEQGLPLASAAEQPWNDFARDVLPRLRPDLRQYLQTSVRPLASMPLAVRLSHLSAGGETACAAMKPVAAELQRLLVGVDDPGARTQVLQIDRMMFACGDNQLRHDSEVIGGDDILKPVRAALADPSRQASLQNEILLAAEKLLVLRHMQRWDLLGHWRRNSAGSPRATPDCGLSISMGWPCAPNRCAGRVASTRRCS